MNHTFEFPCPNCGNLATRRYFTNSRKERYSNAPENQFLKTECDHCDYLMVVCLSNGNVIEAQTSSTSSLARENQQQLVLLPTTKLSA